MIDLNNSIKTLIENSVSDIRQQSWFLVEDSTVLIIPSFSDQVWQSVSEPTINSKINMTDGIR